MSAYSPREAGTVPERGIPVLTGVVRVYQSANNGNNARGGVAQGTQQLLETCERLRDEVCDPPSCLRAPAHLPTRLR
eukprot:817214-Rhodomonas_salina.3